MWVIIAFVFVYVIYIYIYSFLATGKKHKRTAGDLKDPFHHTLTYTL